MMNDLLSIAEYSTIHGCSAAATYKRLSTTLKPYLVIKDGQKYIKIEALTEEELNTLGEVINVNNQVDNRYQPPEQSGNSQLFSFFEKQLGNKDAEIDRLHGEIVQLQQQLQAANEAREESERHNREQSKKLTELLEQSQELNRNNQLLLAQNQQLQLAAGAAAAAETTDTEEQPEPTEPEKKKGFLSWFFGW